MFDGLRHHHCHSVLFNTKYYKYLIVFFLFNSRALYSPRRGLLLRKEAPMKVRYSWSTLLLIIKVLAPESAGAVGRPRVPRPRSCRTGDSGRGIAAASPSVYTAASVTAALYCCQYSKRSCHRLEPFGGISMLPGRRLVCARSVLLWIDPCSQQLV